MQQQYFGQVEKKKPKISYGPKMAMKHLLTRVGIQENPMIQVQLYVSISNLDLDGLILTVMERLSLSVNHDIAFLVPYIK
jgi:hypothetical protein